MKKSRLNQQAQQYLDGFFVKNRRPSKSEKCLLAQNLNVSLEKINIWFQNERAKRKRTLSVIYFIKVQLSSDEYKYHEDRSKEFYEDTEEIKMNEVEKHQTEYRSMDDEYLGYFETEDTSTQQKRSFSVSYSISSTDKLIDDITKSILYDTSENSNNLSNKSFNESSSDFKKGSPNFQSDKSKRIVQVFPTINSLYEPKQKINQYGQVSLFYDGEVVLYGNVEYRMKEWVSYKFCHK